MRAALSSDTNLANSSQPTLLPRRTDQMPTDLVARHFSAVAMAWRRCWWLLAQLVCGAAQPVMADEFRPASLQPSQIGASTYHVPWQLPLFDEATMLEVRPESPPGTCVLTPLHSGYAKGTATQRRLASRHAKPIDMAARQATMKGPVPGVSASSDGPGAPMLPQHGEECASPAPAASCSVRR